MLRPNQSQTNFFSVLYDRIPEDHLLKRIANAVDFSFINELVADSYCASFGRPAKEPELMAKLCILERLYDLSDVKVIEEANCNLAYLWFLGLNPDDPLPDPSLLAVIPVNAKTYKVDEDQFAYNKDSDEWFCRIGNRTVKKTSKTKKKNGKPYRVFVYTFDKEGCRDCPHREECMGRASGGRRFQISENTPVYYQESQRQKSPEFLEKYKKRAAEEWKNAEMKRFHGLARAKGWGLRSMSLQAKFTAIAVNLKRIANLIRENDRKNAGCTALICSLFPRNRLFRKLKIAA